MEIPQDGHYPQTPPPGQYYQPVMYPEQSQSTVVLVLGILGLVFCQVLAPIAWYMGNTELAAIDEGRRDPTNREHANIGRILGIIGTLLIVLALAFFVIWILFAGAIIIGGVSSTAMGF